MIKQKKISKFILLICIFFFVLFFQTIVYSAINSTMVIKGDAVARAETDVRITDFRLGITLNATSNYEEFGKNHIVTEVNFSTTSSKIVYYLEITNYGSEDVGIFDITGLPSEINYSIKDYNLKDKICDNTGKCNSFIKKTYELTLSSNATYSGNIQLNFDFRNYHNISYINIDNIGYPTDIIDGGNLEITFKENLPRVQVLSNNSEIAYYNQISNNQTISVSNITSNIVLNIKDPIAKITNGNASVTGTEVCIDKECFYIINDNGTTVSMLSKYNLLIGNRYDGTNGIVPLTTTTGIQDQTAIAWFTGFSASKPLIGVHGFYSDYYWANSVSTYPSYVYNSNSLLYQPVENYKSYLTSFGITISKARLIKYEELIELGCSNSSKSCSAAPSWVCLTTYWAGSAYSSTNIWHVNSSCDFKDNSSKENYYGARPVIELNRTEVYPLKTNIISGNYDTPGSEVCIGNECFYVISSTDDTVTMISKHNLYVGGKMEEDEFISYEKNATGVQDSTMIGYSETVGYSNAPGITPFSSSSQKGTTYSSYEGSIVQTYVNSYANYLKKIYNPNIEARILTLEEAKKLGCGDTSCKSSSNWLYSSSYWLQTAYNDTNNYCIHSNGDLNEDPYNLDTSPCGVRPVITISKK